MFAGVVDRSDEIEGVERVCLRYEGEIGDPERVEALSTDVVDVAADFVPEVGIVGDRGKGLSFNENMERSSPFQRSPHWWLFCFQVNGLPKVLEYRD